MTTVDWDTKTLIKNLLDSNLSNVNVKITSEGDTGGPKAGPSPSGDKIQIEEPEDRSIDRADVFYETFDKNASIFVTIKSKQRVNDLWEQVVSILLKNRTTIGGNWDRIELEDLSVDDPSFQKHTAQVQINFIAQSQSFDGSVGK